MFTFAQIKKELKAQIDHFLFVVRHGSKVVFCARGGK